MIPDLYPPHSRHRAQVELVRVGLWGWLDPALQQISAHLRKSMKAMTIPSLELGSYLSDCLS